MREVGVTPIATPVSSTGLAPMRSSKGLGEWMALKRREVGLSQAQLASALGVSQQTVARYETKGDRISWDMGWRIISILEEPSW